MRPSALCIQGSDQVRFCEMAMDQWGDHAAGCEVGGFVVGRQRALRKLLRGWCHEEGYTVWTQQDVAELSGPIKGLARLDVEASRLSSTVRQGTLVPTTSSRPRLGERVLLSNLPNTTRRCGTELATLERRSFPQQLSYLAGSPLPCVSAALAHPLTH